jgi:hypothetical protein
VVVVEGLRYKYCDSFYLSRFLIILRVSALINIHILCFTGALLARKVEAMNMIPVINDEFLSS